MIYKFVVSGQPKLLDDKMNQVSNTMKEFGFDHDITLMAEIYGGEITADAALSFDDYAKLRREVETIVSNSYGELFSHITFKWTPRQ